MREHLDARLAEVRGCGDRPLAFQQLLAIQRCCLQVATLAAIDLYEVRIRPFSDLDLTDLLNQMLAPSDGTPVQLLDTLMPAFRAHIEPRFCSGWYAAENGKDGAGTAEGLAKRLERWVSFRNNRPGHGVLDRATIEQEFQSLVGLLSESLEVLAPLLPSQVSSKQFSGLALTRLTPNVIVRSCPSLKGEPLVLRHFRNKRRVWSASCQTLGLESSQELEIAIDPVAPVLTICGGSIRRRFVGWSTYVGSRRWDPLLDIPQRQTAYFEGRESELDQLMAWANDLESRACLLYGDGGIGKTTLTLEFLHNLLERPPPDLNFKPEVICFYSAKLTRWTEHGLQNFSALQPVLEDSLRQLLYSLHDTLDRRWWKLAGQPLVDAVAQELRAAGIERNAVLLIIDNAETLSTKPGDDQVLGELLSAASRRVARVLVTSRRREKIEALPIEVAPMSDSAGATLLRRLGSELKAEAIVAAGDARLRKESRALNGKPILLEALARHIAHAGLSIDDAKSRILRDAQDGLSEFLYEDAWARMSDEHRRVFVVLSELRVPLSSHVVGWVCSALEVPHMSWLSAFEETHFGSKLDYAGEYEIEIVPMAAEFFRLKGRGLSSTERRDVDRIKEEVTRKQVERERALAAPADDRIEEAFRTPEARAAKRSARIGKLDDANLWYEEAIAKDSQNAALYDRYAWFLMQLYKRLPVALKMADLACRLDQKYSEAHFTRGMILYRFDRVDEGDIAIDTSEKLGKPRATCLIQKARARMSLLEKAGSDLELRSSLLNQVEGILGQAKHSMDRWDRYYLKNVENYQRLIGWVAREKAKGHRIDKETRTYIG